MIGRLKPGATLTAAQAQMDTIASRLQRQYPDTNTNWVVNLFSLHDEVVSDARSALIMLTGAVAFVLLIAPRLAACSGSCSPRAWSCRSPAPWWAC